MLWYACHSHRLWATTTVSFPFRGMGHEHMVSTVHWLQYIWSVSDLFPINIPNTGVYSHYSRGSLVGLHLVLGRLSSDVLAGHMEINGKLGHR